MRIEIFYLTILHHTLGVTQSVATIKSSFLRKRGWLVLYIESSP